MQALLLDLDGTVLDSHELIYQCCSFALREHLGRETERAVLARCIGQPLEAIFAAALAELGAPDFAIERLVATYRARLLALDDAVRVFPDIPATLAALRGAGVRLAIVTTKHGPTAHRHLRLHGLDAYFDVVVSGEQCARCKPAPEPFQRALEALGVPAQAAAAAGDSPADVLGARAAGLRAAAACWGTINQPALLAAQPDAVLHAPAELLTFVRGHTG